MAILPNQHYDNCGRSVKKQGQYSIFPEFCRNPPDNHSKIVKIGADFALLGHSKVNVGILNED